MGSKTVLFQPTQIANAAVASAVFIMNNVANPVTLVQDMLPANSAALRNTNV